jgi:hypothetical protein
MMDKVRVLFKGAKLKGAVYDSRNSAPKLSQIPEAFINLQSNNIEYDTLKFKKCLNLLAAGPNI